MPDHFFFDNGMGLIPIPVVWPCETILFNDEVVKPISASGTFMDNTFIKEGAEYHPHWWCRKGLVILDYYAVYIDPYVKIQYYISHELNGLH